MTTLSLHRELTALVGTDAVTFAPSHHPDDLHDESLHPVDVEPAAVVRPQTTSQVVAIVECARRLRLPVTARGSGTGLSGAATPITGGVVVCFDRMKKIQSLDLANHVVVVEPGLTLFELREALAGTGLHYPVHPGELSGSIGGNVNTNAGGMRAVRHGVTRHHVLGLEVVLADASVIRTGGPTMKSSSGYDLTQLLIGSEGSLGLVTEATLKLSPVLEHSATFLVAYSTLDAVSHAVPRIISSGLAPSMLEYLDVGTMSAITSATSLELGVAHTVATATVAYLIVILETRTGGQLELDVAALGELLDDSGALETYLLDKRAAERLIDAREKMFWATKEAGAHEILDVVVPRSAIPTYLSDVNALAHQFGARVTGCGHVGDGNVHLSVYLDDVERRQVLLGELFSLGLSLGGQISGEHGIGRDKEAHYLALSDPAVLTLQSRIKDAFDPDVLFNPRRRFAATPEPS